MNRRRFIRHAAVAGGAVAVASPARAWRAPTGKLAGIQISPYNFLDEGIGPCLDFIQEHAAIDTLFCYSQTYHLGTRPAQVLADDHPTPPRPHEGRHLRHLWMRLPAEAFHGIAVQHEAEEADREYADRDIFAELMEPCRKRGIRIYARILEAGLRRADRIPGYTQVAAVDLDGNPGPGPCWNHPDYREWIRMTIDQMMRLYPLDGLQYGAERVGPLSEVLFRGESPSCFCAHCRARNADANIDPGRAIEGYRHLQNIMRGLSDRRQKPVDGIFTSVLRIMMRYPEGVAWNNQWLGADQEIQAMVYNTAKALRPQADVGQHIDHQRSSWDIIYRAAVSYADIAAQSDFIKPILYHEILGPRLREWVIDRYHERILGDMSKELALDLFYACFGHDRDREPAYADLLQNGLSPEYVYQETRRCVAGAGGKAKVYAGIGLDVPTYLPDGMETFPSDPDSVYLATRRAFEAGATGVVASREYEEMRLPSLQAFGRAVRDSVN